MGDDFWLSASRRLGEAQTGLSARLSATTSYWAIHAVNRRGYSVTLSCTSRVTNGWPEASETWKVIVYSPVSGSAARLIELA